MAIARINGPMLSSNLDRQGVNLAIDATLIYADVTYRRVGISNSSPQYTLDVNGNAHLGNLYILGNTINSDAGATIAGLVSFSGTTNATSPVTGTIIVSGGQGIAQDLWVGGNIYANTIIASSSSILSINDPLLYLNASNPGTYNYETGFYGHFVGGANNNYQHTGLVRNHTDGYWYVFSNAAEPIGSTVNLSNAFIVLDTIKSGGQILANTTPSTSTSTGALQVAGGAGIRGALYITNTGDVSANIGSVLGSLQTISANIGAYESWANANLASQATSINTINANIGAYETWANAALANVSSVVSTIVGNVIPLGSNVVGALVSNAVSLTTSTDVTDAIAQLNYVLGKLVPPSPPNFPSTQTLSLSSATTSALMCNFTQADNSGWGNLSVAGGTLVNAVRSASFTTSTGITNVGPGNNGTVTAYLNGVPNGNVTLTGSNSNTTNGNLYVYNVEDYHNVLSSVTAGFWYVFSTYATGSSVLPGWNRVSIYDSGTGTGTNNVTWYYDNAAPGTPAFSNTSMTLTSNSVTYSSTIPHLNSSSVFTLKGNVNALSGNMYPNSTNLFSTTNGGGALNAPTNVTYASAGVTTPLTPSLYVSSGSAYFQTTATVINGFGSSSGGPTVYTSNSYNQGFYNFTPGATILYNNGSTQILETAITNSFTGASAAYRIVNPDAGTAADNPAYTGSEATFNSTSGAFYATDATVVAALLKYDTTNYSSGYLPIGPNLSTRGSGAQYFTFKWIKGAVSKFNISYTGTIAGLWVALPGSSIDTTASPTNGWLNMAAAYAGSGVPGTGSGGNGSAGCATGGTATLNSNGTYSVTCTFGTVSSTSATNNEIYIRIKLTSGQSVSVLSIANPTN